jgi:hypothetical protein
MMCDRLSGACQAGGGQPGVLLLLQLLVAGKKRKNLRAGKGRTMTPRLPHAAALLGLAGAAGQPAASVPQEQQQTVSPSLGPTVQQLVLRPRAGASSQARRQQLLALTALLVMVSGSARRARQQQQAAAPRPASPGSASQHSGRTSDVTKVSVYTGFRFCLSRGIGLCAYECARKSARCMAVCHSEGQLQLKRNTVDSVPTASCACISLILFFLLPPASASGYGSKFLSKAAVKGGGLNRKWAYKGITKSGKLIRVRRQAPHMAGQVRHSENAVGFGL